MRWVGHTVHMAKLPPLTLTPHLHPDNSDEATLLLQGYYAGLLHNGMGFEGGWWDGFDPSGTRDATPDAFTADDLLSASLLSIRIPPTAVLQILGDKAGDLGIALRTLGQDRELATLSASEVGELEAKSTIWRMLRSIPSIGPTTTSKLIARKRPNLIPIYDGVVGKAVYGDTSRAQWARLHEALTADGAALNTHLKSLRARSGLPGWISPLRIFDVIAWLDASGKAKNLLRPDDGTTSKRST